MLQYISMWACTILKFGFLRDFEFCENFLKMKVQLNASKISELGDLVL